MRLDLKLNDGLSSYRRQITVLLLSDATDNTSISQFSFTLLFANERVAFYLVLSRVGYETLRNLGTFFLSWSIVIWLLYE